MSRSTSRKKARRKQRSKERELNKEIIQTTGYRSKGKRAHLRDL